MAPHAPVVTLPGVTHLMPLQDPVAIAELIERFVADPRGGRTRTAATP